MTYQPRSDLLGLIQILIMIFGEEPPVFSKPQQPPSLPYPINSLCFFHNPSQQNLQLINHLHLIPHNNFHNSFKSLTQRHNHTTASMPVPGQASSMPATGQAGANAYYPPFSYTPQGSQNSQCWFHNPLAVDCVVFVCFYYTR